MTIRTKAMLAIALAAAATGCGPTIERVDPDRDVLVDDKWNDVDLTNTAKQMVQSMLEHPVLAQGAERPTIMVGTIANGSREHIDVKPLTERILTALLKSGKVRVIDETARGELAKEYEYQASGNVDPATRKGPGRQRGADYLLRGEIAQDQHKGGGTSVNWYLITMRLTALETNERMWQEEFSIKKVKSSSGIRP